MTQEVMLSRSCPNISKNIMNRVSLPTNDLLELEELCQGLLLLENIGQCIAIEDRQEGVARFS